MVSHPKKTVIILINACVHYRDDLCSDLHTEDGGVMYEGCSNETHLRVVVHDGTEAIKIFRVGVKAGIPLMFHPRTVHVAGPVAVLNLSDLNLYCFNASSGEHMEVA
jgi:hypothetical protein